MFLCLADTGLQRTISYFSTRARVWLSALFCSDDAQAVRLVASRARVGTVEYGRGAVQVTVHWKAHEARKRLVYEPRALSSVRRCVPCIIIVSVAVRKPSPGQNSLPYAPHPLNHTLNSLSAW